MREGRRHLLTCFTSIPTGSIPTSCRTKSSIVILPDEYDVSRRKDEGEDEGEDEVKEQQGRVKVKKRKEVRRERVRKGLKQELDTVQLLVEGEEEIEYFIIAIPSLSMRG